VTAKSPPPGAVDPKERAARQYTERPQERRDYIEQELRERGEDDATASQVAENTVEKVQEIAKEQKGGRRAGEPEKVR